MRKKRLIFSEVLIFYSNMKIIEGTFVSAEDIITELRRIRECLDVLLTRETAKSGSVVWASQATLARRYDTSKSTICRLLAEAVSSGHVRMIRPHSGVRKYHVAEFDAFMMSISIASCKSI